MSTKVSSVRAICNLILPKCLVVSKKRSAGRDKIHIWTHFTSHFSIYMIFIRVWPKEGPSHLKTDKFRELYIYIYIYIYRHKPSTAHRVLKSYRKKKKGWVYTCDQVVSSLHIYIYIYIYTYIWKFIDIYIYTYKIKIIDKSISA